MKVTKELTRSLMRYVPEGLDDWDAIRDIADIETGGACDDFRINMLADWVQDMAKAAHANDTDQP